MRILFLTQVLPFPLDAGPKVRAYYVLKHLSRRGHEITLVSFVRDDDDEERLRELGRLCREVHTVPIKRSHLRDAGTWIKSVLTGEPFLIARDQDRAMSHRVQQLLQQRPGFDAVHSDQLWMASYALLGASSTPRPKLVLDQHNAVFQIPRRLAAGESNPVKRTLLLWEARKLASYERDTCGKFDDVVWVTRNDWEALFGTGGNGFNCENSKVIPICVEASSSRMSGSVDGLKRITFVGGMHWPPNAQGIEWFVGEVWPRIRAEVKDCRLTLVGKCPPRNVLSGPCDSIDALGYVANLERYLSETAVFIVPLHSGGGMRVKILEAWKWGLPVVSTTVGAEGLQVSSGKNLILADSAESFASAVKKVLEDPELALSLRRNGQTTLDEHYDWEKVYSLWDSIYQ